MLNRCETALQGFCHPMFALGIPGTALRITILRKVSDGEVGERSRESHTSLLAVRHHLGMREAEYLQIETNRPTKA